MTMRRTQSKIRRRIRAAKHLDDERMQALQQLRHQVRGSDNTGDCGIFRGLRDRRCSPSVRWKKSHRSRCLEHNSFTRRGVRYIPGHEPQRAFYHPN